MLANFNIETLNRIKDMRAEEYDYDKFLSDSSDDYPKYSDGLLDDCFEEKLVSDLNQSGQNDDGLDRPSSTPSLNPYNDRTLIQKEDLKISIQNVIELAEERVKTMLEWDSDKVIAQKSLKIVKVFLIDLKDSNIELAKSDSD